MKAHREQLTPEVRARTIVAGCARATIRGLGSSDPRLEAGEGVGVLVDGCGSAWLVLDAATDAPVGEFRITCRSWVPSLGVLRLDGGCSRAFDPDRQRDGEHLLAVHSAVWTDADMTGELRVVPVDIFAVTVLTPATDERRAEAVPVELWRYRAAAPDGWLLHADQVRDHIEAEHQRELRELVRDEAGPWAPGSFVVSIRSMTPDRLDLSCLCPDGVTNVSVGFGQRLEHPALVGEWMAQAAR